MEAGIAFREIPQKEDSGRFTIQYQEMNSFMELNLMPSFELLDTKQCGHFWRAINATKYQYFEKFPFRFLYIEV